MKVIIAGGRNYEFSVSDVALLNDLHRKLRFSQVVSGGAKGADAEGETWASVNDIPVVRFPADWAKHGKAAGPIRNKEMAKYADALVVFSGGRGTENMISAAATHELRIYRASRGSSAKEAAGV